MIAETVCLEEFALKKNCSEYLIVQGVRNHILFKCASSPCVPAYWWQYSKHLSQFSDQSWWKTDLGRLELPSASLRIRRKHLQPLERAAFSFFFFQIANSASILSFAYFLLCQCQVLHEMYLLINYSCLKWSAVAWCQDKNSYQWSRICHYGEYVTLFQHKINLIYRIITSIDFSDKSFLLFVFFEVACYGVFFLQRVEIEMHETTELYTS